LLHPLAFVSWYFQLLQEFWCFTFRFAHIDVGVTLPWVLHRFLPHFSHASNLRIKMFTLEPVFSARIPFPDSSMATEVRHISLASRNLFPDFHSDEPMTRRHRSVQLIITMELK
jgi:hypothetical protein